MFCSSMTNSGWWVHHSSMSKVSWSHLTQKRAMLLKCEMTLSVPWGASLGTVKGPPPVFSKQQACRPTLKTTNVERRKAATSIRTLAPLMMDMATSTPLNFMDQDCRYVKEQSYSRVLRLSRALRAFTLSGVFSFVVRFVARGDPSDVFKNIYI